ncbi:MAG TPA: hypothetical protein PLH64_02715 [Anaerolineaceae bacterium]|nr:hypothetical protein [Anaerolineaceae bacterium]
MKHLIQSTLDELGLVTKEDLQDLALKIEALGEQEKLKRLEIKQSRLLELCHKPNNHQSLRIWIPTITFRYGAYPGVVSGLVEEEKMILGRVNFRKEYQRS